MATLRFSYEFLNKATWGKGCFVEDYLLIASVVQLLKPRTVLEIGTSTGLGAVLLASAGARVTTVDVDQSVSKGNLDLIDNIAKQVTFIEGDSSDILPRFTREKKRFDLVFIDGDHSYKQASLDWQNSQTLTSTWILHDTTQFSGLQRLVSEIRKTGQYDVFQFLSPPGHRVRPKLKLEQFCTGLTLVQKLSDLNILKHQTHRGDDGKILAGHSEAGVPNLQVLYT